MKKNLGSVDRIVRMIIEAIIIVLYGVGIISGSSGLALMLIATVLVITGVVSSCPLYVPFGLSTFRKRLPRKNMTSKI